VALRIQTTRVESDVVVVHLAGSITASVEGHSIEPLFNDLLNQAHKKFVFDLSAVEQIDSSGIDILIRFSLAARKAGGGLRLAGAGSKVARLFKILRLDAVVPCYPTVAAACERFTVTPESTGT
jgi:anti-sigma B factor antagonist